MAFLPISGDTGSVIGENISLPSYDTESAPLLKGSLDKTYGIVTKDARQDGARNKNHAEIHKYRGNTPLKFGVIITALIGCVITIVHFDQRPTNNISNNVSNTYTSNPSGSGGWVESGQRPSETLTSKSVPFPAVDRSDYNDDASTIVFPELFHPLLRYHPSKDTKSASKNEISSINSDLPECQGSTGCPLLNIPFPTGAFWTNLVIEPTTDRGISYPIMVYPYGYKWSPTMMQISYPPLNRLKDSISIRDIFNPDMTLSIAETVTRRNVIDFDPLSVSLRFYSGSGYSAEDGTSSTSDYDNYDNVPYWESYLVQGSPYITATYMDVTPILSPLSVFQNFVCPRDENGKYRDDVNESTDHTGQDYGICSKKHTMDSFSTTLSGVQFLMSTQENLTWMLFASEPITLIFDRTRRTIKSTHKYQGTLRLALIPPQLDANTSDTKSEHYTSVPLATSTAVKRLITHSHVYPVRSKLSWDFKKQQTFMGGFGQGNKVEPETLGSITFEFETRSMHDSPNDSASSFSNGATGDNDLLMLALPHHRDVLPTKMLLTGNTFDVMFNTIKGKMTPVVGNIWSYEEALTNTKFDSKSTLQMIAKMKNSTRDTILYQVKQDLTQVLPSLKEDVYGFGKQIARLAQLAHIAYVLEPKSLRKESSHNYTNVSESSKSLVDEAGRVLHGYLTKFLDGLAVDKLLYDRNFGGIVSQNGLINDLADFGNGRYNDHHFHYGYLLYASAVMAEIDDGTFISNYGSHVDAIFFDVSYNPEHQTDMQFFPTVRHKSWFDGHSFASGLFPFADGKSQESSSEAVNCYYGAYLWSLMRKGPDSERQTNFAKLLLAMEIRGAKTYWHMEPSYNSTNKVDIESEQIYDSKFESSYMVGNLGMMDVTIATWFGKESLYVHMINVMPITAITRELFDKSYVKKEYEAVIRPIEDNVEMAWRGYTICDRAMFEPTEAWNQAIKLKSYLLDSGISLSQIYFWISTTTGFTQSAATIPDDHTSKSGGGHTMPQNNLGQLCTENEACNAANLTGLCCPTQAGTHLGCCDSTALLPDETIPDDGTSESGGDIIPQGNDNQLCIENGSCKAANLTGLCCPAMSGNYLECCN